MLHGLLRNKVTCPYSYKYRKHESIKHVKKMSEVTPAITIIVKSMFISTFFTRFHHDLYIC